jgi:hypothetical protein
MDFHKTWPIILVIIVTVFSGIFSYKAREARMETVEVQHPYVVIEDSYFMTDQEVEKFTSFCPICNKVLCYEY